MTACQVFLCKPWNLYERKVYVTNYTIDPNMIEHSVFLYREPDWI